MTTIKLDLRHYEDTVRIKTSPANLFAYIDDHTRFSSHMNKSSWMMGGGRMDTSVDEGKGQVVGSHIKMSGKAFGISLALDEVVTRHEAPTLKTWETVDQPKLIIIGHYKMGIEIKPMSDLSSMRVYIDYDLPTKNTWLGKLFSAWYAKWCVQQMIQGALDVFGSSTDKRPRLINNRQ